MTTAVGNLVVSASGPSRRAPPEEANILIQSGISEHMAGMIDIKTI